MANSVSKDLFNKIKGTAKNLTLARDDGQQTLVPDEAVFFEFDYMSDGRKLGSMVVSLVDEGALKVYFFSNLYIGKSYITFIFLFELKKLIT